MINGRPKTAVVAFFYSRKGAVKYLTRLWIKLIRGSSTASDWKTSRLGWCIEEILLMLHSFNSVTVYCNMLIKVSQLQERRASLSAKLFYSQHLGFKAGVIVCKWGLSLITDASTLIRSNGNPDSSSTEVSLLKSYQKASAKTPLILDLLVTPSDLFTENPALIWASYWRSFHLFQVTGGFCERLPLCSLTQHQSDADAQPSEDGRPDRWAEHRSAMLKAFSRKI